jgi:GTP-binding protein
MMELRKYDELLYQKPRWLIINKVDMLPGDSEEEVCMKFTRSLGWSGKSFVISALSGRGCKQLIYAIMEHLEQENKTETS